MKKIAIASIMALAAISASAMEVGVTSTKDYSASNARQGFGVSVSQKVGGIGLTGAFERFTKGTNDQDRYSVTAGYDVAKFGPVTITPKVGVAYLNNQATPDGYALTVGVGASVPVTKSVALTVDAGHQYGQHRVKPLDGNRVTAGLSYSF